MTRSATAAREAIGPRDDELDAAARLYRTALPDGELSEFDIGALDRLGHAVVIAALRSPEGFSNDGFGYGASRREALVGALGEMSETYHVHRALHGAPACESMSLAAMVQRFGADAVIDPMTLCLPAGSPWTDATPLRWVAVRGPDDPQDSRDAGGSGERDTSATWVPRECVATSPFDYATRSRNVMASGAGEPMRLFRPITCGLGAGTSLAQALSHGTLELLQRDGNCTRFRALDRGIDLELDRVDDPGIARILAELKSKGVRVRAKLATTDFDLVNLYVIGEAEAADDDFALMATACGEAVHANRERALRKALLEYIAARTRKTFMHGPLDPIRRLAPKAYGERVMAAVDPAAEEPRALAEMIRWLELDATRLRELLADSVFGSRESRAFSSLPSTPDVAVREPADRLADLSARLRTQRLAIHHFDASPAGSSGPRVVKAIVPGLEGETLSYARIGERGVRRLADEWPELVAIGAPRGTCRHRVLLTSDAQERLGGPAWFDIERAEAIVGPLYPLYREPSSHSAQVQLEERGR